MLARYDNRPVPLERAGERAKFPFEFDLVEDNPGTRRSLVDLLTGDTGVQCLGAHATGEAALRCIPEEKPQVALVDINYTRDYVRVLGCCGVGDLRRSASGPVLTLVFTALTFGAVRFYRVTGRKNPLTPAG